MRPVGAGRRAPMSVRLSPSRSTGHTERDRGSDVGAMHLREQHNSQYICIWYVCC